MTAMATAPATGAAGRTAGTSGYLGLGGAPAEAGRRVQTAAAATTGAGGRGKRRGRRPAISDPFVGWLEDDRLRKGMTRQAYAAQFDISESHWSHICSGLRRLTRELIEIISRKVEGAGAEYDRLYLYYEPPGAT